MLTISELLIKATRSLDEKNIKLASLEARLLLQSVIGESQEYLIKNNQQILASPIITQFNKALSRRINFEPIAYILEYKEFYGRDFYINQHVLIPRADTETLVEAILKQYDHKNFLNILDLGAGSGCIIITLLLEFSDAEGTAVDISAKALNAMQKNVERYNLNARLKLVQSNWFENLGDNKYDIIVSNPPYIDQKETNLMSEETLKYEPKLALFASDEGLLNYHIIAQNAKKYLQPQGQVWLEIGYNQAEKIKDIFLKNNYQYIKTYQDLALNNRVMVFKAH